MDYVTTPRARTGPVEGYRVHTLQEENLVVLFHGGSIDERLTVADLSKGLYLVGHLEPEGFTPANAPEYTIPGPILWVEHSTFFPADAADWARAHRRAGYRERVYRTPGTSTDGLDL